MKPEKLAKLLLVILLLAGVTFRLTGCKDKETETKQAEASSGEYLELAEDPFFELPIVEPNILAKEKTAIEQQPLPDEPNQ